MNSVTPMAARSDDMAWYERLREQYRPDSIELLLIAESAPNARGGERRFFYAPTLAAADNLFRGVIEALYGYRFPPGSVGTSKIAWFERLCGDGVFLIDVVPFPVNKLRPAERSRALRKHAPEVVSRAKELGPAGIIVCHTPTFRAVAPRLHERGLPLLHQSAIPFPLGNKRAEFVAGFRAALSHAHSPGDQSP
jgi:hypothetical protein